MSNCIENHPASSLLIAFCSGLTLSWAILTFIWDDNRERLHKAEIESKQAEINMKESLLNTYVQKINVLEQSNKDIKVINGIYLECISQNPNLTLYLKNKLEKIIIEKRDTELNYYNQSLSTDTSNINIPKDKEIPTLKKIIKTTIKKYDSYINEELQTIIGIQDINVNRKAIIYTNLNNKLNNESVGVGKTYDFTVGKANYRLIIKSINYIYDNVEIEIIQL